MRLSRIRLSGFKTFVDPTTLELPGSLTGIVGPNGCGKSNVIDAVRWVLGESSARSLRAEAGTDVIFNGSGGRRPAGRAMVELSFDNADGQAGGAWAGVAEIAVRRELARDGQSSWFLNNRRALKRDVQDVFLGTGLGGRQQYAILEQGSIARLVEARPEELRQWLEEAAGISRYRERRRETAERVAAARGNLATLEATRHDLAGRVATLARQAEEALFWRDAKREERALTLSVLALAARAADRDLGALTAAEGTARQVAARAAAAEADAATGATAARGATDAARLADALAGADAERRAAEADTAIAALDAAAARAQSAQAEATAAENRLGALASRRLAVAGATRQATAAASEAAAAQATATDAERQATRVLAEATAAEAAAALALAEARETVRPLAEQQLAQTTRSEALVREAQALAQQQARLDAALVALGGDGPAGLLAALGPRLADARQQVAQATAAVQAPEAELARLREDLTELERASAEATREHDTETARLAGLETLQAAALNPDDRARRHWLERHGLATAPRLAERVRAPQGWEAAVERVLADAGVLDAPLSGAPVPVEDAAAAPATGAAVLAATPATTRAFGPGLLETPAAATPWLAGLEPAAGPDAAPRDGLGEGRGWLLPDGTRVYRHATVWPRRRPGDGVLVRARTLEDLRQRLLVLGPAAAAARDALLQRRRAVAIAETARREAVTRLGPARAAEARLDAEHRAAQLRATQVAERRAALEDEREGLMERLRVLATERQARADELAPLAHRLATERATETRAQAAHAEARRRLEDARAAAAAAARTTTAAAIGAARAEAGRAASQQTLADLEPQETEAGAERDRRSALHHEARAQLAPLEAATAYARERRAAAHAQQAVARTALAAAEAAAGAAAALHDDARQADGDARSTLVRLATQIEDAIRRQGEAHLRFWQEERLQHQADETPQVAAEGMNPGVGENAMADVAGDGDAAAPGGGPVAEPARTATDAFLDRPEPAAIAARLASFLAHPPVALPAHLADAETRLARVRRRLDRMGAVNLTADTERAACAERLAFLDAQRDDLLAALAALEQAIHTLDAETRQVFEDVVGRVDATFAARFARLFGGGTARLERTDADWLAAGVRVVAQPPGKKNAVIQLLSGGEKAMTALALLLALFEQNPAPFCLLDEVDAPLDDANVGRFCDTVREMSARVQFIVITHNKLTMELATHLHGVTMREPGVSRLVGVDLDAATRLAGADPGPDRRPGPADAPAARPVERAE